MNLDDPRWKIEPDSLKTLAVITLAILDRKLFFPFLVDFNGVALEQSQALMGCQIHLESRAPQCNLVCSG